MSKAHHDRTHHAKIASGIGDPQCFAGKAGQAKFKVGDQVQIRDLPDLFYSRTMAYTRGAIGTVVRLVYESPPAEDEAWDNTDRPVWFYSVVFKQQDLWPEYSAAYPNDTVETEFPETYLASA